MLSGQDEAMLSFLLSVLLEDAVLVISLLGRALGLQSIL